MRVASKLLCATLSLPLLGACATDAIKLAPARADRPWTPKTTPDGEIVPGEAAASGEARGHVLPVNHQIVAGPEAPVVDSGKVYALPELIDLAEENNPATAIAWRDARRAALAQGIARTSYLPRVALTAIDGSQWSKSSNTTSVGPFSAGASNTVSAHGTVSAVSLEWLLFDFGEREALVDVATQGSIVSNIAFTAAHQQVIYEVALAFYQHAAARARLATERQALANAHDIEAAALARRRQGIGTVVEVAQAHQGSAQAVLSMVRATGGERDAYLKLITAIGVAPTSKLKIADLSHRRLSRALDKPVDRLISEAVARRPDVQSAYALHKASLARLRAAQSEMLPKIFVSAAGAHSDGSLNVSALPSIGQQLPTVNVNGNGDTDSASVFLGVTMPIYDGGSRLAMAEQARNDVEGSVSRLVKVRQDAIRQIALSENALKTSLQANEAARSLVAAAQTTYDAALAAYKNGVGSITEVVLAQSQLIQAKTAAADAHSTALSAAATLALATGALGSAPEE